jgi:gas vesicle protein
LNFWHAISLYPGKMRMNSTGKFITGFLLGSIGGLLGGLVFAPASGKRTRKKISKKSRKFARKVAGYIGMQEKFQGEPSRRKNGKPFVEV